MKFRWRLHITPTWLLETSVSHEAQIMSRDSSVGIATGCGMEDRGVGVRDMVGSRMLPSPCRPHRLWDPSNPISNGYGGALSPGVKRQGLEVVHSPPTSAEVKNLSIYLYIHSPMRLHGVVLSYLSIGTTLPLLYHEAQTGFSHWARLETEGCLRQDDEDNIRSNTGNIT
jgi:hypothetical protein